MSFTSLILGICGIIVALIPATATWQMVASGLGLAGLFFGLFARGESARRGTTDRLAKMAIAVSAIALLVSLIIFATCQASIFWVGRSLSGTVGDSQKDYRTAIEGVLTDAKKRTKGSSQHDELERKKPR